MYERSQPSILNLFGTVILFVVAAGYGIISLSTEDPIWFVQSFEEQADEVIVYCMGREVSFRSDSPHLEQLNALFNEALSGSKNWDSLTMSHETYAYYQTSQAVIALEFRYSPPVRVHSIYKYFSGLDAMVVPLVGRHAKLNAVFGRIGEENTSGALHVGSTAGLLAYIASSGLCAP